MDGLDEFEKSLAEEKTAREKSRSGRDRDEKRRKKHTDDGDRRHHHAHHRHHHHHRSHEDDKDRDEHRNKRSRYSHDSEERDNRHGHHHSSRRETASKPPQSESNGPVRDAWMTAPSALDIDYVHRQEKKPPSPPPKTEPERVIHQRELNRDLHNFNPHSADDENNSPEVVVDYDFGDEGSNWRMTKLKAIYTESEDSGRPVDEIALERYGSLQEFDIAQEEKAEVERRKVYGDGYARKYKPTGEIYRERIAKQRTQPAPRRERSPSTEAPPAASEPPKPQTPMVDQTTLNRMKAQMMKAKLRRAPNAAQLEEEYNVALAGFSGHRSDVVALGGMESRMLTGHRGEVKAVTTRRGRERGNVEENNDMTLDDMVREERRTRGQAGGEGMRLAERIAKDGKFDNDLEYMDENAERLAKRVHKSEINLKNSAVSEFQKINRILDRCPLCHHEDTGKPPVAPVVSLATRVYLTLPTEPELTDGAAMIVPISHRQNLLECDDDEWEEIRNFMKSLTRMYHDQGREVVFYENAAAPNRHPHAAMAAVPIPYEEGATAPAYFKEAFLSSDEEWSQHRKIIDTGAKAKEGLGKSAFRRTMAKEMPYFHVWFTLDGGLGHIVENANLWPRGDLFAREVLGGILDTSPEIIKKQGHWHRSDQGRAEGFKKRWRKFDWTRVLADG